MGSQSKVHVLTQAALPFPSDETNKQNQASPCSMDVPDNKHLGDDCDSLSSTFQLSINEIAARHPRERLLVHPLRWTDRQVTLLDCRIHSRCVSEPEGARSTAAHENANPDAASSNPDDDLVRLLARRLNYQISWENWIDTARRLLRPLGRRISVDDW